MMIFGCLLSFFFQSQAPPGARRLAPLIFFIIIVVILYYFRFIKPYQKKQRYQKALKEVKLGSSKVAAKKTQICIRCKSPLITKRFLQGGLIFGSEEYEKYMEKTNEELTRVAYKCRHCGALQCKKCAEKYPCLKCGYNVFDIFITSER